MKNCFQIPSRDDHDRPHSVSLELWSFRGAPYLCFESLSVEPSAPRKSLEFRGVVVKIMVPFWVPYILLGCSGDLVSRLSNGPYGASYGLLRWLMRDTKWTY